MKIAVGGDHAGFPLKSTLIQAIQELGHEVQDYGCHSEEPVDFPDIAADVCNSVRNGETDKGIMICGTGVGAAIAANKTSGIRAAVCHDVYSAHQCVEHDDVNVFCIGAQIVGYKLAIDLIDTYLKAKFSTAPEFRRRVDKLHLMDEKISS